ncbi:MAG TPA: inosine/xanthosine triphosphatase [Thermoanaerobaculaceae bacterium]|nr:inosine/xanthosine triphosphatase [Thermoanaerobaculaceae bacterium]
MRLAVGSTREPKLAGVKAALERLAALPWPGEPVELVPVDAASGQADTPLSALATLAGARARARTTLGCVPGADLALGLEGGVEVVARQPLEVVLRNWAVAWDGVREGIGSSAGVMLPGPVAEAVLAGEDLAAVIDRWAAERDVRSRQGAFGVLTAGLVDRAGAYLQAVLTALAPFYAPAWAGPTAPGGGGGPGVP